MKKIFLLFLFFAFSHLAASQIVYTTPVSSGNAHCPDGGTLVLTGEDINSDGALEEGVDDIDSSAYICNGENGCDVLVTVTGPSNSYNECKVGTKPKSGVLISSGVDCNSDGVIDSGQAAETVLCYGTQGSDGGFAVEGGESAGGTDGANGNATTFVVNEEPAGENCAAGGLKVETSFDSDGNGTIEDSEISVEYVCNGESPQGSQGEPGEQGIAGTDGKDGAQGAKGERGDKGETGEAGIEGEAGEAGDDGYDSLLSVVDEPAGDHCANGGKKFLSGADTDRNGVLDESEVKNSYYICNGEDAVEASEQAASSGCTVSLIDDNSALESFYSMISNVCRFVSDLF